MEGGGSLMNIGDLSKPATVLIEKISDAIGGYFKPYQVRRVATAEADAERIRALAEMEISDLQRRALQRFVAEEAKKQDNIEAIASQALPEVRDHARPEEMEDDWVSNFFDKARLISDDEMQQLWSKVLAGEANAPGRFSKRTVSYLASLDKDDAQLFKSLLGYGWMFGGVVPLVYDVQDSMYTSRGLNFSTLTHLDEIGLVTFENLAGFQRLKLPKKFRVLYYSTPVVVVGPADDNSLSLGQAMLSKVGQQLAPVVGSEPVQGFLDYVIKRWKDAGFTATVEPAATEGNGS